MKKRLTAMLMCIAILVTLLPTAAFAAGETLISDRAGLEAISGSGNYRLTADIDLAGEDWTPLSEFSGTLDGGDHIIRNLSITDTTASGDNKGLFSSIAEGGQVKNIGMEGVNITAGNNTGAITGTNRGTISRCYTTGTVSGNEQVGGLVGVNAGTVENCFSRVSVSGTSYLGGIAGSNSGNVTKCYAASTVTDSVLNNYLQFAGTGDSGGYIDIPDNGAYRGNAFTLEAWFQWDGVGTDGTNFIIGKGTDKQFEQFEIHTGGGSGENGLRFIPVPHGANQNYASLGGYQGDSWIDVHNVLQEGWFHVAAVYWYEPGEEGATGTAYAQVYVNGEAQDLYQAEKPTSVGKTATLQRDSNPLADNEYNINIGRRTGSGYYFHGKIADVRFWNTARTAEEIKADKDKVLTGTETGLVGYWKLNDAFGEGSLENQIVDDATTYDNNGTIKFDGTGGSVTQTKESAGIGKGALIGNNTSGKASDCFYDSEIFGSIYGGTGSPTSTANMKLQSTYSVWDFISTWKMGDNDYPNLGFKTVSSVSVTPATVSVENGKTQQFTATVAGTNSPAQTVTWSVTGGVTGTSIDTNGLLTVAADETAATLTVRATSTSDTTKSGTATVTVTTGLEGLFAGKFRAGSQIFDCQRTVNGNEGTASSLTIPYGYLDGWQQFAAEDLTGKYFMFKETSKTNAGKPVVGLYLYNAADDTPAYVAGKMPEGGNGFVVEGTVALVADEGILFISTSGYGGLGYLISNAAGYNYNDFSYPNPPLYLRSHGKSNPSLAALKEFNASDVLLEPGQILLRFYPNGDGVTGMPENGYLIKKVDEAFTIAATLNPARDGYEFVSWNRQDDGSGVTYEPGAEYTSNVGINMYAQWRDTSVTEQPQAAPTGVSTSNANSVGGNGGITGTTAAMQYRTAADAKTWYWCTDGSTAVPAGEYWVRYAAKEEYLASPEVNAGKVLEPSATPVAADFTVTHVSTIADSDGKIAQNNAAIVYEYSINGGGTYQDITGNEITGLSAGAVLVRKKAVADESIASAPLTLYVKQPAASAPSAAAFTVSHVTTYYGWDGSISGVTTAMEYQYPGSIYWHVVTQNGSLTDLGSGNYTIRYKETAMTLPSESVVLFVKQPFENAPAVGAAAATAPGGKGAITGTTTAMEYNLAGSTDGSGNAIWTVCSDHSTSVAPGVYTVRYQETTENTPLPTATVTVSPVLPVVDGKNIFANGLALVITGEGQEFSPTTSTIYIDENRNGTVDTGEKSLKEAGVAGAPADNTDLTAYFVFGGGASSGNYDTQIVMLSGEVAEIHGGSNTGVITGNASITVSGGAVSNIHGGSFNAEFIGNTNITISGGTINNIDSGGVYEPVSGNTTLKISGGTIKGDSGVSGSIADGAKRVYLSGNPKISSLNFSSFTDEVFFIDGVLTGQDGDIKLNPSTISENLILGRATTPAHANAAKFAINEPFSAEYTLAHNTEDGTIYTVANRSTLTVDPNGGKWNGSTDSQSFTQGYGSTKDIPVPTRTGYTFTGWTRTNEYGILLPNTGAVQTTYNFGSTGGVTDTLTAQWTANEYAVTLDGQSATVAGTTSVTATYGENMPSITKPQRNYTVTFDYSGATGGDRPASSNISYTFGGYFSGSEGGTKYYDADGQSAQAWDIADAATLYAHWTAGSSLLPAPTKTGYDLAGWYTDAAFTTSAGVGGAAYTPTADITLTAKWTANTYTVTYETDGGSDITAGSYNIESTAFTLPTAPTKTGYAFTGWKVTTGAEGGTGFALNTSFAAADTSVTLSGSYGDVTLTAQWTANTYTVTYNTDGGSAITAGSYDIEDASFTLPTAPTKTGYTFAGWKVTSAATGGTGFASDDTFSGTIRTLSGSYGDVTLTAQWTANSYSVTYHANSDKATGEMNDQTLTYDVAATLTANSFANTGFTFSGWNTASDGKGSSYADQQSVKNLLTEQGDNLDLYAQWTEGKRHNLSGMVTDGTQPISGAAVKLMQGADIIAETTTDRAGKYAFTNLLPGTFNLVVAKDAKTVTVLYVLEKADETQNYAQNVTLPTATTNSSTLRVTKDESIKEEVPKIVVGGLEAVASTKKDDIAMTVTQKAESKEDNEQKDISDAAGQSIGMYLEVSVLKGTDPLTDTGTVLEIVVPYSFAGKTNMKVWRHHDAAVEEFAALREKPTSPFADATFFADKENNLLYIYASKFSTYAVSYTQVSSGAATYPVRVDTESIKNGTVTVSLTNASAGTKVTVTVKPDAGYQLKDLVITDKNGMNISYTDNKDGTFTFTQPIGEVNISAAFLKAESPFTDVSKDAYYYDAVLWAVSNGVTQGASATTFSPASPCTRAQVVTFLWRAMGSPEPTATVNPFMDVKADAYYYQAVLWAVEKGIIKGTSETTFSPDTNCSRAHIVTMLWRMEGFKAATSANPFADVSGDAYYANAVLWAVDEGITVGTSATTFSPDDNCTRAQIVTFIYRNMK